MLLLGACGVIVSCNQNENREFKTDSFIVSESDIHQLSLGMTRDEIVNVLGKYPKQQNNSVWRYGALDGGEYYMNFFEIAEKGERLMRVYHLNRQTGKETIILETKNPIDLF